MTTNTPLILGSASARREQILSDLKIPFEIHIPQVEEVDIKDRPIDSALQNAKIKNDWCRERHPERHIITADTIVVFENRAVHKPKSIEQASEFLSMFSNKRQTVVTAVALTTPGAPPTVSAIESEVVFKELAPDVIGEYFAQVDPLDKAGGYDIDQCGEMIIESFSGSYTNIMGLPTETIEEWLRQEGLLTKTSQ